MNRHGIKQSIQALAIATIAIPAFLALLSLTALPARAQDPSAALHSATMRSEGGNRLGVRRFEAEIRFPVVTNALVNIGGTERASDLGFGFEFRYNLDDKRLPLDFGLGYEYSPTVYEENNSPTTQTTDETMDIVSLFADYNFRQTKKFNPFVGLGAGIAYCETEDLYTWVDRRVNPTDPNSPTDPSDPTQPTDPDDLIPVPVHDMGDAYQWNPVLIPRIGFEAWGHLRVSAYLVLCKKGLSNFSVSLGWSIGGGKRPVR